MEEMAALEQPNKENKEITPWNPKNSYHRSSLYKESQQSRAASRIKETSKKESSNMERKNEPTIKRNGRLSSKRTKRNGGK